MMGSTVARVRRTSVSAARDERTSSISALDDRITIWSSIIVFMSAGEGDGDADVDDEGDVECD